MNMTYPRNEEEEFTFSRPLHVRVRLVFAHALSPTLVLNTIFSFVKPNESSLGLFWKYRARQ